MKAKNGSHQMLSFKGGIGSSDSRQIPSKINKTYL
jgi:hypothetical protein